MIRFLSRFSGCGHHLPEKSGQHLSAKSRISEEISKIGIATVCGGIPTMAVGAPPVSGTKSEDKNERI